MGVEVDWLDHAACRDVLFPDAWFPEHNGDGLSIEAGKICRTYCPVREQCEAAGAFEKFGIWGGQFRSEGEARRARIRSTEVEVTRSSLSTQRRLQSLAAIGWSGRDISSDIRRYTGTKVGHWELDAIRDSEHPIAISTNLEDAVRRSFKRMGNTCNSSSALIETAASRGWPTPRQWRGYDIEDPGVSPLDQPGRAI